MESANQVVKALKFTPTKNEPGTWHTTGTRAFFKRPRFFETFFGVEITASCFGLCGCNFEGMEVHIFSFCVAKSPYSKLENT